MNSQRQWITILVITVTGLTMTLSCTPTVDNGPPTPTVFEANDVQITLPPQSEPMAFVEIGFDPKLQCTDALVRTIVDFKVVYTEGEKKDTTVTSFDPPMEIVARFNEGDLQCAQETSQELVLGYFDEEQQAWVIFEEQDVDVDAMMGTATTDAWGDRQLCWCSD